MKSALKVAKNIGKKNDKKIRKKIVDKGMKITVLGKLLNPDVFVISDNFQIVF